MRYFPCSILETTLPEKDSQPAVELMSFVWPFTRRYGQSNWVLGPRKDWSRSLLRFTFTPATEAVGSNISSSVPLGPSSQMRSAPMRATVKVTVQFVG